MNNEEQIQEENPKRNIWNLVLGIAFLGYGGYRLYQKIQASGDDTFGIVLAVAFIGFGIFDLYKYFTFK